MYVAISCILETVLMNMGRYEMRSEKKLESVLAR